MRLTKRVARGRRPGRRLLAVVVIGLVVSSGAALAADLPPGGTFTDDDDTLHEPYIEALVAAGITRGCASGQFCPDRAMTRAEMVTVWLRGLRGDDPNHRYRGYFADVPEGAWFCGPVEQAYEMGLIDRYDAGFRPHEPVSRSNMAAFLGRALGAGDGPSAVGYFSDVPVDAWYAPYVERVYELGITAGCRADPPAFCPADLVTRGEMATLIGRAFALEPVYPPGVPTTTTTTDPCPPG